MNLFPLDNLKVIIHSFYKITFVLGARTEVGRGPNIGTVAFIKSLDMPDVTVIILLKFIYLIIRIKKN